MHYEALSTCRHWSHKALCLSRLRQDERLRHHLRSSARNKNRNCKMRQENAQFQYLGSWTWTHAMGQMLRGTEQRKAVYNSDHSSRRGLALRAADRQWRSRMELMQISTCPLHWLSAAPDSSLSPMPASPYQCWRRHCLPFDLTAWNITVIFGRGRVTHSTTGVELGDWSGGPGLLTRGSCSHCI